MRQGERNPPRLRDLLRYDGEKIRGVRKRKIAGRVSLRKLDARLIDYLYKTRIERLDKILKEIDDRNLKIEAAKEKN